MLEAHIVFPTRQEALLYWYSDWTSSSSHDPTQVCMLASPHSQSQQTMQLSSAECHLKYTTFRQI